jgi:hypothetical protein
MKNRRNILIFICLCALTGCISQFIPETSDDKDLLVVEGLITNNLSESHIKLSKSSPLGSRETAKAVSGGDIFVTDNLDNTFHFYESEAGKYLPQSEFHGTPGNIYKLHVNIPSAKGLIKYESMPMKMVPVPEIDSVTYAKKNLVPETMYSPAQDGCQIYVTTHDPSKDCNFYRWEYDETWEFILPYNVPNKTCWVSSNSEKINIKNTSTLERNLIDKFPLTFISNNSDRLKVRYSILVKQYSMNEDEFSYWEKLQNISEQVGSLYDIIPSSVPSNVFNVTNPTEKVLGYFSVSASVSKRIFIKDRFSGLIDLYLDCPSDTLYTFGPIPNLNNTVWVIIDHPLPPPSYRVITYSRGCADCTARGTKVPPDFWTEY